MTVKPDHFIAGDCKGYVAQWRHEGDDTWKSVPWHWSPPLGGVNIPAPHLLQGGGVITTIGLLGQAQAWAVAWHFAAMAEAEGRGIEVRLQEHAVHYEITATLVKEG
jgi:hypothetical protein